MPEKAEAEQESDDDVQMGGSTLEEAMYGTLKKAATPRKKGGRMSKRDTAS